jgi:hypothetical protein
MVHGPRFTISLKRGAQNLSAIHKPPADYPIFWHKLLHIGVKTPMSVVGGSMKV